MCDLTNPNFTDAKAARKHLEGLRWADGRFCPHCGGTEKTRLVRGKKHRPGLYYCNDCKKQFTVTVGTVFERSKVPLNKWMLAFHLMASSKKGISAHQLHRMLGVTYKTAWFMAHRIREAMRDPDPEPLGGKGKTVEADETFIGKPDAEFINGIGWVKMRGVASKRKVISLVERGGRVRSFKVDDLSSKTIRKALFENIVLDSNLHTDQAQHYKRPGREFASHEAVNHSEKEYARGDVTNRWSRCGPRTTLGLMPRFSNMGQAAPRSLRSSKMADKIDWAGASGSKYTYSIHDLNWVPSAGQDGNYIFAKQVSNGWHAVYVGQGDLQDRRQASELCPKVGDGDIRRRV